MKTRVRAYVFIVIAALIVSPAGQLIAATITELTDQSLFLFYYPFAITPLETRGCENIFGFTVQAYHVARLLFWMILPGGCCGSCARRERRQMPQPSRFCCPVR